MACFRLIYTEDRFDHGTRVTLLLMGPNDPENLPSFPDVVTPNGDKRVFTATIVLCAVRKEGLGSDNLVLDGAFYARLKMRMNDVTGGISHTLVASELLLATGPDR